MYTQDRRPGTARGLPRIGLFRARCCQQSRKQLSARQGRLTPLYTCAEGLTWQVLRNLYQPVVQRGHVAEVLDADVYQFLP